MWFLFASINAAIGGSRRVYEKNLTNHFSNFSMGFIVQAFSLIPTLGLFFFLPLPEDLVHFSWLRFWMPLLIIWIVLYPVQTYFGYRALREGELSSVTPILALLPAINVLTSYFFIGEEISFGGILGISAIVAGVYLMLKKEGTHMKRKPEIWMIISVLCFAVGSTLDKVAIRASTPVFYSFVNTFGATIVFIILMYAYRTQRELGKMKGAFFWPLTILGISQAIAYTARMLAFQHGPTSYVLAISAGSNMIAALWGLIILKESFSGRKKIAFACFFSGVILLAFA